MESRIDYMDLDTQLRYYEEQLEKSKNRKGTRPSPTRNPDHKPIMPRPPRATSELGMIHRGGRYTPGRIRVPTNK